MTWGAAGSQVCGEEGGGAGGVVSYSLTEATGTVSTDIFMVWVVGILGILDWSGGGK